MAEHKVGSGPAPRQPRVSRLRVMRPLVLAVALLGLAAACRRPPVGPVNPQAEVAVSVDNQNFLDMDVFIVRATQRIRLGMVPGLSSRVLMVRPELIGYSQDVRSAPVTWCT